MDYNIFSRTAPAMPNPSKGTEIVKLLLSQASKDMRETLVPMLFPSLGAHISGTEIQYPDRCWKERKRINDHFGGRIEGSADVVPLYYL